MDTWRTSWKREGNENLGPWKVSIFFHFLSFIFFHSLSFIFFLSVSHVMWYRFFTHSYSSEFVIRIVMRLSCQEYKLRNREQIFSTCAFLRNSLLFSSSISLSLLPRAKKCSCFRKDKIKTTSYMHQIILHKNVVLQINPRGISSFREMFFSKNRWRKILWSPKN